MGFGPIGALPGVETTKLFPFWASRWLPGDFGRSGRSTVLEPEGLVWTDVFATPKETCCRAESANKRPKRTIQAPARSKRSSKGPKSPFLGSFPKPGFSPLSRPFAPKGQKCSETASKHFLGGGGAACSAPGRRTEVSARTFLWATLSGE